MCRIRAQTRSHCKHSFCQTQAHDTEIVAAAIYKPIPCNHISILPRMHHIELNHLSIKSLIRHLTRERQRETERDRERPPDLSSILETYCPNADLC